MDRKSAAGFWCLAGLLVMTTHAGAALVNVRLGTSTTTSSVRLGTAGSLEIEFDDEIASDERYDLSQIDGNTRVAAIFGLINPGVTAPLYGMPGQFYTTIELYDDNQATVVLYGPANPPPAGVFYLPPYPLAANVFGVRITVTELTYNGFDSDAFDQALNEGNAWGQANIDGLMGKLGDTSQNGVVQRDALIASGTGQHPPPPCYQDIYGASFMSGSEAQCNGLWLSGENVPNCLLGTVCDGVSSTFVATQDCIDLPVQEGMVYCLTGQGVSCGQCSGENNSNAPGVFCPIGTAPNCGGGSDCWCQ